MLLVTPPKKLLWTSNVVFSDGPLRSTGNWVLSMGSRLAESGMEICNVALADVSVAKRQVFGTTGQWLIPRRLANSPRGLQDQLRAIEDHERPELVHVWGTENFAAHPASTGLFQAPAVLEIQGLLYAYAKVFFGGLSLREILACTGRKELLMPWRHLLFRQRDFEARGRTEIDTIRNFKDIGVQSSWVESHIRSINPGARIHHSRILLRREFLEAPAWNPPSATAVRIFTSTSAANSYKGLHTLLRAFALLRKDAPRAKLAIAGSFRGGRLPDGYETWLGSEIRRLGISDAIEWLGPLSGEQLVEQLLLANVAVIPSFAETYCLALAESLLLGTPTAVSFAGAMPEFARDEETALFFPPGDEVACARQIMRLASDPQLRNRLSAKAREIGIESNRPEPIVRTQMEIYRTILGKSS